MAHDSPSDDTSLAEALARVTRHVRRHAERSPYALFPDEVVVRNVLAKMAQNLVVHGRAYCPCRPVPDDPAERRRDICPCASHQEDIARDGFCECRLFVSQEYLARRRAASPTDGG